ncbi:MAG: insulinase family protein [Rhodobacteraceae bacterium]|nr:insulinase family protein [Paracoccaceae bacterium]
MTVEIARLPNGVRVVTEHMPGLMSASVGLWIAAGGRHERPEQNGIAHFLEHMAFKGTTRRNALQIAEEIEDVGGYINAYTSREMTAYYARVMSGDVPLALDVVADIVLNPLFEDKEIEVERHVILQEIGQALDTPDDIIFDWLQEAAFPDQAIGRTILGPSALVSGFGRDDLTRFVAERYAPDRMIVSAAGGVDHDAIVAQVTELFGHLEAHGQDTPEPARFAPHERREHKGLEQAHMALGLRSPGYRDPDIYTSQIFATTLGGGMSSRLFQEIREKRGLCYTIFAQAGAYADAGLMTVYAGTGAEELGQLSTLVVDEIKRAAEDMSEAEVQRARAQIKGGILMGLESASSRAERLARMLAIWDRVPPLEETIAAIDAVSVEDVRAMAQGMAGSGELALALYGPLDTAPKERELSERLAA